MAGLFGARMKKPPYFAPTAYPVTPGSASPASPEPFTPTAYPVAPGATGMAQSPQAAPAYGKPDTLHTIAGIVGDSLAQWQGGQPIFAQTQAMRQKAMYDAAQANRERAAKFADETAMYDYKLAHPQPANNDTANDYEYIASKLGPEAATQYLRNFAAGQPIVVRNPDGTITPVSRDEFVNSTVPKAAPPGVTFTPIDGPAPVSASTAAPILRGASTMGVMTPDNAARIRASRGPNGQAAFDQWRKQHNVTIGGQ